MSDKPMFERSTTGRFSSGLFGEAPGRYMFVEVSRRERVELTRADASLDVRLSFTAEQARAVADELIAAADWIEAQA